MDDDYNPSNGKDVSKSLKTRESRFSGFDPGTSPTRLKQLEVIHLRMAGKITAELIRSVRGSIVKDDFRKISIRTYLREELETDLLVHLHYEIELPATTKPELGEKLASSLREYGMVEHSIWKELG